MWLPKFFLASSGSVCASRRRLVAGRLAPHAGCAAAAWALPLAAWALGHSNRILICLYMLIGSKRLFSGFFQRPGASASCIMGVRPGRAGARGAVRCGSLLMFIASFLKPSTVQGPGNTPVALTALVSQLA